MIYYNVRLFEELHCKRYKACFQLKNTQQTQKYPHSSVSFLDMVVSGTSMV